MNTKTTLAALLAAILFAHPQCLMAQSASPAPAASPAASTGDKTADYLQRVNDKIKATLKATDEEWPVIEPLLFKVETAQRLASGRASSTSRKSRTGASADASGSRPGLPEADALKTALDSDGTSTDEIKARLQAFRDARKRAIADLEQAREDLKQVLTLRQEAALVQMGILD